MKNYKYTFIAKLIYKYANIPATLLLSIHLISSIILIGQEWYHILPAIINAAVIYIINRFYLKIYRQFPFLISIDNEKMICSGFVIGNRKVEVKLSDIDSIKGGIFSGQMTRPVYIHDGKNDVTLGFYNHIKEYNKFITTVLSNIKKDLYDSLLVNMKELGDIRKGKVKKKNKKARR